MAIRVFLPEVYPSRPGQVTSATLWKRGVRQESWPPSGYHTTEAPVGLITLRLDGQGWLRLATEAWAVRQAKGTVRTHSRQKQRENISSLYALLLAS